MYSGVECIVCCYSECISHTRQAEKSAWPRWESNPRPLVCQSNALPTELRGQVGSSVWYFGTQSSSFDISMFLIWYEFYCCVMYSGVECIVCCYSECISHTRQAEKSAWPRWESNPRPLVCQSNALPTELRGQVGSSVWYFGTQSSSFDISMFLIWYEFYCCVMYSGVECIVCCYSECISHTRQAEKSAWPRWESNPRPLVCQSNALPTELRGQVGSSVWYFGTQSSSFDISMFLIWYEFYCCVMYSGVECIVCCYSECISHTRQAEKSAWPRWESNPRPLVCQSNALPTELRGQVGSSVWYFGTQSSSFDISMFLIWYEFYCCVMYSGVECIVCCYSECISHTRQAEKSAWPRWESNPRPLVCQSNALPTELRGQVGSSVWYFGTQSSSFDISMFLIWYEFYCCVMYSGVECIVCCYSECISHTRQAEKSAWPRWESNPRPLVCQSNALPTELRGQVGSSVWYFGTQSSSFDISMFLIWYEFYCCVMYSGVECIVCCYSECISHTRQAEKSAWPRWESNPRPLVCQSNALPTELRGQVGSSVWYFGTQSSSFDISMFLIWYEFYCCVMYSGVECIVCCYSECISHTRQAEKSAWPRWESNPRPFGLDWQTKGRGFDSHRGQADFSACLVWDIHSE